MKTIWDYHERRDMEVAMFADTLKGMTIIPEAKAEEKVTNGYMFQMFKIWGTSTENRLRVQLSDPEFNVFDLIKERYPDTELTMRQTYSVTAPEGTITKDQITITVEDEK